MELPFPWSPSFPVRPPHPRGPILLGINPPAFPWPPDSCDLPAQPPYETTSLHPGCCAPDMPTFFPFLQSTRPIPLPGTLSPRLPTAHCPTSIRPLCHCHPSETEASHITPHSSCHPPGIKAFIHFLLSCLFPAPKGELYEEGVLSVSFLWLCPSASDSLRASKAPHE